MALTAHQIRHLLPDIVHSNLSNDKIAKKRNHSKNTIKKYRDMANDSGLSLIELQNLDDDQLKGFFQKQRSESKSMRRPNVAKLLKEKAKHKLTNAIMYLEYVESDPQTALAKSSFDRILREGKERLCPPMRLFHPIGECVFTDFTGKKPSYFDITTGKDVEVEFFTAVSGYSKLIFGIAVHSQKVPDYIYAHKKLYEYFGGVYQVEVTDNLKSAVINPGKEYSLNPVFQEFASHYGYSVYPARVYKPKDKAIVESSIRMIYDWVFAALRHRRFFSLEELNAAIMERINFLNARPFKEIEGCRFSLFEEEKSLLGELPKLPFELGKLLPNKKVRDDYHVVVEEHYYSVPWGLANEIVDVKIYENLVKVFYKNKLQATHKRSFKKGFTTTDVNHMPPNHRAYALQNKEDFLEWANVIGVAAMTMVTKQYQDLPEHSIKARMKCRKLKEIYRDIENPVIFEDACEYAIENGLYSPSSLMSIIKTKRYRLSKNKQVQLPLPFNDDLRGEEYFIGGGLS